MSKSECSTANYSFMGFFEVLSLIFVIAKITGYIAWSWWWVFAPIIVHAILVIVILAIVLFIVILSD